MPVSTSQLSAPLSGITQSAAVRSCCSSASLPPKTQTRCEASCTPAVPHPQHGSNPSVSRTKRFGINRHQRMGWAVVSVNESMPRRLSQALEAFYKLPPGDQYSSRAPQNPIPGAECTGLQRMLFGKSLACCQIRGSAWSLNVGSLPCEKSTCFHAESWGLSFISAGHQKSSRSVPSGS